MILNSVIVIGESIYFKGFNHFEGNGYIRFFKNGRICIIGKPLSKEIEVDAIEIYVDTTKCIKNGLLAQRIISHTKKDKIIFIEDEDSNYPAYVQIS